jgi:hypothetical protein
VSTRVWYGTACLLIRDAIGSMSCSIAWGMVHDVTWIHMVQDTASGAQGGETVAKHDELLL